MARRYLALYLAFLTTLFTAVARGDLTATCAHFAVLAPTPWWEGPYASAVNRTNPTASRAFASLGKRYEANDPHAVGLLALGWRRTVNMDGNIELLPPHSPEVSCLAFRERTEKRIRSGEIAREDALDVAIPFERKTPDENGNLVFMFVRPGIDPWPPPGDWVVADGKRQISHEFFYTVVATGRFPLFPGNFYHHDLAHLTELMDSPVTMKLTRRYARRLTGIQDGGPEFRIAPNRVDHHADLDHIGQQRRRSHILTEWMSVPNVAMAPTIRKLVPEAFQSEKLVALKDHIEVWKKLPEEKMLARAKALMEQGPMALLRMGGAIRDPYNLGLFAGNGQDLRLHLDELRAESRLPSRAGLYEPRTTPLADPPYSGEQTLARETLHGQLFLLRYALSERDGNPPDNETQRYFQTSVDYAIRDICARIETSLANGVKLGITPEKLLTDARLDTPATDSATFQWLRSYARNDGFTYYAFDLHRKPAPLQ